MLRHFDACLRPCCDGTGTVSWRVANRAPLGAECSPRNRLNFRPSRRSDAHRPHYSKQQSFLAPSWRRCVRSRPRSATGALDRAQAATHWSFVRPSPRRETRRRARASSYGFMAAASAPPCRAGCVTMENIWKNLLTSVSGALETKRMSLSRMAKRRAWNNAFGSRRLR